MHCPIRRWTEGGDEAEGSISYSGRREAAAHHSPVPHATLIALNTAEYEQHLRRAYHCDVFVDSLLCNAHTSATDALWAGTPLLTLPGETQTARVATSLLEAVGLPQLRVRSLREYEDQLLGLFSERTSQHRASPQKVNRIGT